MKKKSPVNDKNYGDVLFKFHLDNKKSNFFRKKRIRFFLKKFDFLLSKWNLNKTKLKLFNDTFCTKNKYFDKKLKFVNKYIFNILLYKDNNKNNRRNVSDKYLYYIINDYYTDTKVFLKSKSNYFYSNWNFKSLNVNVLSEKYKLENKSIFTNNSKYFSEIKVSLTKTIFNHIVKLTLISLKYLLLLVKVQWITIILLLIVGILLIYNIVIVDDIYKFFLYKVNELFSTLFFQSFFFFDEFFFKKYFFFDFSYFFSVSKSGISLLLEQLIELLREDTDLGFLFFTFLYPFGLWIGSNIIELVETYILPYVSPFFPQFYFFLEEWIEFFFSKNVLYNLFPPYLALYTKYIDTHSGLIFSIADIEYKTISAIEKIKVFKYTYMESWFGEFKSIKVISPWREYMNNSKLPLTMEYNVYYKLYVLYNNSNFFFINYDILHNAFKTFVPNIFNGYYYIFNTINLLEINMNTHSYYCKNTFNIEEWELIKIMSNKIRELVNRNCVVYNSYFLIKKILDLLFITNYNFLKFMCVNTYECMRYMYCDTSFISKISYKLYCCINEITYVYDMHNKYISLKLYVNKLYRITMYNLYWYAWEALFLGQCIMNVYAKWLLMYIRYRDIPLYLSRFWSVYLADLFHLTSFNEKYFFGFIKKHFILTETYIRMMEFREAYLTSKSTVIANLSRINEMNEILYENYKNQWFLYEEEIISGLKDKNIIASGRRRENIFCGNYNYAITDKIVDKEDIRIYVYILHFFLEEIVYNFFQEKMKNIDINTYVQDINSFMFYTKFLILSLSEQYKFLVYAYNLIDNCLNTINYIYINNFFISIIIDKCSFILRKFFLYFYDLVYLREFFGNLDSMNYRADLNLSKVIVYLTNPYSEFKLKHFVDWKGMALDYKNVIIDKNSIFSLMLKDGIFFFKKLPRSNFFLDEYINLNKIFLYWNDQFVTNMVITSSSNALSSAVTAPYFKECGNILDWIHFSWNWQFLSKNVNFVNLVDISLYEYIYINIFYYDYYYTYMYGEFSFLKFINDYLYKYNRVFLWEDEHINKFSFFFDRYYNLLQNNVLDILFSVFAININIYSFSGLINILCGLQNFCKNFVVVGVLYMLLSIYLVWYHMYLYVYKYDVWTSIINLLYPKDLDYLLRNIDLNKKRGNFFYKGITSTTSNNDICEYQKTLDKLDILSLKIERLTQNNLFWVKRRLGNFLFKLSNLNFISTYKESIYRKFLGEEELILDDDNFITKRRAKELENLERYGDPTINDEFRKLDLDKLIYELNGLNQDNGCNLNFSWKEFQEMKYEDKLVTDNDIFESVWWNWEKKYSDNTFLEEESINNSGYTELKKNILPFDKDNIYKDIVNTYYQFSQFSGLYAFSAYVQNDRIFSPYSVFFSVFKILKKSSSFFFFKPICKNYTVKGISINNYFVFFYPYLLELYQLYKYIYIYLLFFNVYLVLNIYMYMAEVCNIMCMIVTLVFTLIICIIYKYIKVYIKYKIWNINWFQKKYLFNLLMIIIFFVKNINYIGNFDFFKARYLNKNSKNFVSKKNNSLTHYLRYNYEILSLNQNGLIFSNLSYNTVLYFNNVYLKNLINNFCFSKALEHSVKVPYLLEKKRCYKYLDTSSYSYFYLFKYYISAYDIVFKTQVVSNDINKNNIVDYSNMFKVNGNWYYNVYTTNNRWFSSFNLNEENDIISVLKFKKNKETLAFVIKDNCKITTIFNVNVQDLFKYFYIPINKKLFAKYRSSLSMNERDNLKFKINLINVYSNYSSKK